MSPEEARFVDLEMRYMHLERTVEELSDVVAAQSRMVEALVREVSQVTSRMKGVLDANATPGTEKPPHY